MLQASSIWMIFSSSPNLLKSLLPPLLNTSVKLIAPLFKRYLLQIGTILADHYYGKSFSDIIMIDCSDGTSLELIPPGVLEETSGMISVIIL